ncbi:hypothetical protein [Pandoraea sp. NPDC090278]|uniref:hypothetical protein n=1 Tax=Pandoraea sp. NPDC090278 TaxID=3364391 RepID=UPI00383A64DB
MEPITFKQCFVGAWIDGFNALRNRPLLSLIVTIIVLVSSALGISLKQLASAAAQGGDAIYRLNIALMSLGVGLVNLIAFAVLTVHILRYVILGPEVARQSPWYGRDVWRYIWLSLQLVIAMMIAVFIPAFIVGFATRMSGNSHSYALLATFIALMACAAVFVITRISLIYAQVAVGRSKRWGAAWQDSRGHFWSMFGTAFVTFLPLFGTGIVITVLLAVVLKFIPEVTVAVLGSLILKTVFSIAWLAVACGVGGWLYHRYANQLLLMDGAPDDL